MSVDCKYLCHELRGISRSPRFQVSSESVNLVDEYAAEILNVWMRLSVTDIKMVSVLMVEDHVHTSTHASTDK